MPFIPTANGVKVEVNAVQNGVPIVNVQHVQVTAGVTPAELATIGGIYRDWYTTNIGIFHPSYVLQNITCTDISVEDGAQSITPFVGGLAGTASGAPLAANAAMCASLRSDRTGRSYRGRWYLGGLSEAVLQDAQNFTTASVGGVAGIIVDLIDALQTAGYVFSVLSLIANKVARVAGVLTEITSILVDTKVDSQRRRTAN